MTDDQCKYVTTKLTTAQEGVNSLIFRLTREITRSKLATTNIAKGISNLPAILNLRITYNDFGHDKPDVKLLFDRRITSLLYMDISGNRLSSLSERAFINCGWLRKL
ncbi:hypothetical protein TrispH2_011562 [Trichoplax sp. H2]|nr:hypothetical protein TrispH2_011562 [Trichoplax sp. H2]|eukprot:RDD36460.1 hypothetical protein TrispH2_011562 [Trichoplax sp. H2]